MEQVLGMCKAILTHVSHVGVAFAILVAMAASLPATIVRFDTSAGHIDVRLYNTATPLSVQNFLNYAQNNAYDDTFIHRNAITQVAPNVFEPFVIQGGGFKLNGSIFDAALIPADPPVMNEPGISNLRGTIAYAKGSNPDSATSQWFFNLRANTGLDLVANGAFTVFGRVVGDSMSIVDAIAALPNIDASVAENGPAEDFDEVPVFDVQKVLTQQDVRPDDAVMIHSIDIRNLPAGDYNFDGAVTLADYIVWRNSLGSTLLAEADGNGNGVVDNADYQVWLNAFGQTMAASGESGASSSIGIPEPTSTMLVIAACSFLLSARVRPS